MNFPTALRLIEREEQIETRKSRANDQNVARFGELRMNFGGVRVVQEPLAFLFLRRFTRRKVSQRENDLGGFQLAPGFPNQLERSICVSHQIDDFITDDIKRPGQRTGLAQQILDVVAEDQTRNKCIGTQFVDAGRAQIRRMRLQPSIEVTDIVGKRAHLISRDVEEMLWIGGAVRHAASEGLAAINPTRKPRCARVRWTATIVPL